MSYPLIVQKSFCNCLFFPLAMFEQQRKKENRSIAIKPAGPPKACRSPIVDRDSRCSCKATDYPWVSINPMGMGLSNFKPVTGTEFFNESFFHEFGFDTVNPVCLYPLPSLVTTLISSSTEQRLGRPCGQQWKEGVGAGFAVDAIRLRQRATTGSAAVCFQ